MVILQRMPPVNIGPHIPKEFFDDLEGVPGFDRQAFEAAHQLPAPVSVRLHPLKGTGLFADALPVPWCADGRFLPERPVFTLDPAFHYGGYYVQEASSMFLSQVMKQAIDGRKGLRVLDLCAAPGGKSTLIASMLDSESLLLSNEVIRNRASVLEENIARWGYMNTWVCSNDPRDLGKLTGYFDIIVVDAPCSGSGLWRKDPAAISEWSENNVQLCSGRQQRILADIWPALKQDGILVYATCSYSPAEDEDILDWMANNWSVQGLNFTTPGDWGVVHAISHLHGLHGYRFFPHMASGEGFFIAAIKKLDTAGQLKSPAKREREAKPRGVTPNMLDNGDYKIVMTGDNLYSAIHTAHTADQRLLSQTAYLRKTGTQLGSPAAKEWIPAHDIALSIHAEPGLPCLDLSREQALRFLKREDMGLDVSTKGWLIARYNGHGLGWIKALGNRFNNYLPKTWRIRMEIE